MKFVIFADRSYNYVKPIAEGLYDELIKAGHEVWIFYDGLFWLMDLSLIKVLLRDILCLFYNIRSLKKISIYIVFGDLLLFGQKKLKIISDSDAIIIVNNCPSVFYKKNLKRIEYLRDCFTEIPIVNYDFHFLPNQGWYKRIKNDNNLNFGLERFDWYLCGSIVTEFAVPKEIPKIYNEVGFSLRRESLYPEQSGFFVLLDFPRKGYEKERAIQKAALRIANIEFLELSGKYTREEIRKLYRKASILFLSFRESFGLPILEIQLCGGKVFLPTKKWAPAHFLNKDIYQSGVGDLGDNFIEYSDLNDLIIKLKSVRSHFNPQLNISLLKDQYPNYFEINKSELNLFIDKIRKKEITAKSHLQYIDFNKYISIEDDIDV